MIDKLQTAEWKLSGKCPSCGESMIHANGFKYSKSQEGNLICRYYYCPSKPQYRYGYQDKEMVDR